MSRIHRLMLNARGRPIPKLIRGDETPENLAYAYVYVLAKEWPAGGVISSEAGVVLGAHGMGKWLDGKYKVFPEWC